MGRRIWNIAYKKRIYHKKYWQGALAVCLAAILLLNGCGRQEKIDTTGQDEIENVIQENFTDIEESGIAGDASGAETGENRIASDEPEVISEGETIPADVSPSTEKPELTLVMVGDILLHTPVEESALQEDGSYDFSAVFAHTAEEISAADLAIVNQEVIIGGEELGISGYPAFNAPYEVGEALARAGFDVVCHGTNHALDKGRNGVRNCLDFWKQNYPDMAVLGINGSQEEQDKIYFYEQDNIRIAVLNYTYGTNGIKPPEDMPYAVDMLEEDKVLADIARAKGEADFTIVCPHWGTEYHLEPDAYQQKWTKLFLENGVDLVLGTHPHVIEPIEWARDEETGHEMLVYYSLGNFVNWTSGVGEGIANRMVGGMARITVSKDEDGKAYIEDYGIEALVCHLEKGKNGVTTYMLKDYPESLAQNNAIIAQDAAFSRGYCENLCDRIWGELWRRGE